MLQLTPRDTLEDGGLGKGDVTHFWRVKRHAQLDCLKATFRSHVFPPHTHETYVIGATVAGRHRYLHRGSLVTLAAGQCAFINPGEVHDGAPDETGYSYRMMYPQPELLQSILYDATGREQAPPRFSAPTVADAELAAELIAVHRLLEQGGEGLGADERLTAALLKAIARHAGGLDGMIAAGDEPAAVTRAKEFLAAHVSEAADLKALAGAARLSAWHLIRVFRKATGLTPHAWLVDQRVHRARQMLREGLSPGDAAALCGFSDQAHMTRLFKARLGVTPGQYRALAV